MKFGIEKYAILIIKRVKRKRAEGIEPAIQEKPERCEKRKIT